MAETPSCIAPSHKISGMADKVNETGVDRYKELRVAVVVILN